MIDHYFPIEVIFNLLSICRSSIGKSTKTLKRFLLQRGFYYGDRENIAHLGFWLNLCKQANLLDESTHLYPTLFVPDWLALSIEDQYQILLKAWKQTPKSLYRKKYRQELLSSLMIGEESSYKHQKELYGLENLNICEGSDLTTWGHQLLISQKTSSKPIFQPWQVVDEKLHIPYPPDWHLLWQLEAFLEPCDPGIYSIDEKALRFSSQSDKDTISMLSILSQGLQQPVPQKITDKIKKQPTIKIDSGLLLEFSSSEELLQLRKNSSNRKIFNRVLSPHHIFVDQYNKAHVLQRLARLKLINKNELLDNTQIIKSPNLLLTKNEKTYLLSLIILNETHNQVLATPPGLLEKIVKGLPFRLRAAAVRKAHKMHDNRFPNSDWKPEKEMPSPPNLKTIKFLNQCIENQESIDILYHKPTQKQPEYRRITPIIVEQRHTRFYLIAFCHTRKANRTFRLDRLEILNKPPLPRRF